VAASRREAPTFLFQDAKSFATEEKGEKEKGCEFFCSVRNPQVLSREFSTTNPRPGVLCHAGVLCQKWSP